MKLMPYSLRWTEDTTCSYADEEAREVAEVEMKRTCSNMLDVDASHILLGLT